MTISFHCYVYHIEKSSQVLYVFHAMLIFQKEPHGLANAFLNEEILVPSVTGDRIHQIIQELKILIFILPLVQNHHETGS